MNEQLKLLIETQKLDTEIISRQRTIDQIPLRISSMEKPIAEARENLEARKKKFEAAEKKKRDQERNVEEIAQKIEKLKERTPQIKTNTEYTALLKEIESAEKEKFSAEDQILELMELVDAESISLKGAEAALKAQEERAAELKKELEAEVQRAEGGLDELKDKRNAQADRLDPDAYDIYMDLLETRDGLAVVEARNEICLGCNMNIMPQLFLEIKKNEELIHCPQCRRFLYASEEVENPSE
jgi:predicted  nucleic acid-binding Zn-ribbon protein